MPRNGNEPRCLEVPADRCGEASVVAACMSLVPMAKPTHSSGRRAAFSLMEVIVATAVLAAAGAALFALIGQASQLARKAQRRTDAIDGTYG